MVWAELWHLKNKVQVRVTLYSAKDSFELSAVGSV